MANDRVYRRALEDPAAAGMGTTVTVAVVDGAAGTVTIGHVGDSRAYRIRSESLEQLTADHSLVAELVRTGRLTPQQAADHPHRSVITRAVGTEPSVDVDTFTLEALAGDLYLLCSDGLTDMVDDAGILTLAETAAREPEAVARALVDAANRAGGSDNITVVAFEVVEGEPDDPAELPVAAVTVTAEPADAGTSSGRCHTGASPRRGQGRPCPRVAGSPRRGGSGRPDRLVEHQQVSTRNRELINLVLVGILGTAAFGSAWIARTNRVSADGLVDVAVIAAVFVAAHMVVRFTAPHAEPTLLPLAALLTAIGLTVNYRLDPAGGKKQAIWVGIGVLAFALTLIALRFDYRVLEQYRYLFGVSAIGLLAPAFAAGSRRARQRRSALDPRRQLPVPAG